MAVNFTDILQGDYLNPNIPYELYVFDLTVNAIFSFTTVVANTLIMTALKKISLFQVHSVFKAFLFNLAIADLAVGIFVQPMYIATIVTAICGYPGASRILATMFYLGNWCFPNISVSFLTVIAIDRFLALHFRLRYRNVVTFNRVVAALVFLWILKFGEALMVVFDYRIFNVQTNVGLGFCMTVITFCYLKIYLTLRHHDSTVRGMNKFPSQTLPETCRQEGNPRVRSTTFNMLRYKRTVYDMLFLYAALIFCYLPAFCVLIVIQTRGVDRTAQIARFLAATIIFANSSLNPLLYCWRIRPIRRTVWTTLRKMCCK